MCGSEAITNLTSLFPNINTRFVLFFVIGLHAFILLCGALYTRLYLYPLVSDVVPLCLVFPYLKLYVFIACFWNMHVLPSNLCGVHAEGSLGRET